MIKKYLVYSTKLSCTLCIILLISCTKKIVSENEQYTNDIKVYLQEKHQIALLENITKIFILTDKNCHTCNKYFAKTIEKNINDNKSLFIISASSSNIDLSLFYKAKNVVYEKNDGVSSFFDNSKILFLTKGTIDTIINIKLDNLASFPKEIESRP